MPHYSMLGAILWVLALKSGVHATFAGVETAFFVPFMNYRDQKTLEDVEHGLTNYVSFLIVPLFLLKMQA